MTLNLYANAQKIGKYNLELFVYSAYKFTFTIVPCNINVSIQNNVYKTLSSAKHINMKCENYKNFE